MSAKRGLGRGFATLIPTDLLDESFDPTAEQDGQVSDLRNIKISEIHADPHQPRREFDEEYLLELSESIREHGVLQPIVVTVRKEGGYIIVAGERRWRASKIAGIEKIPALVRTLTAQHKLEISLIENVQRQDLNPVEMATAYKKLQDQFNLTYDEIGTRVGGKSGVAIMNFVRLLRLPKYVLEHLSKRELTEGQARSLVGMHEDDIAELVPRILKEGWSVRRIEQIAREMKKLRKEGDTNSVKKSDTEKVLRYVDETKRFKKMFNAPVKITSQASGSGRVIISFKDDAEFQRIAEFIERK